MKNSKRLIELNETAMIVCQEIHNKVRSPPVFVLSEAGREMSVDTDVCSGQI